MTTRRPWLAFLWIGSWALAQGSCTSAATEGRSDDADTASSDGKDGDGQDAGNEPDGSDPDQESVEVPVPIFLTDPGNTLDPLGQVAEDSAAAKLPQVESDAGGDGQAASLAVNVEAYSAGFVLARAFVVTLVHDVFDGKSAQLKGGKATVFAVKGFGFPPELSPDYVRISLAKSEGEYFVEAYCERDGELRVCVEMRFAESKKDKTAITARTQLIANWNEPSGSTKGEWTIRLDYGDKRPFETAVRKRPAAGDKDDVAFGIMMPPMMPENRNQSVLAAYANKDLPGPVVFPDLPRARSHPTQRKKGDLLLLQSQGEVSSGDWARRTAFVPAEGRNGEKTVEASAYQAYAGDVHMAKAMIALTRDPLTNEGCATSGTDLGIAANLCESNSSVSDEQVLDAFEDYCVGGQTYDMQLVVNRKLGNKASVNLCLYQYFRKINENPQYFVTMAGARVQLDPEDVPTSTHLKLAAELSKVTMPLNVEPMRDVSEHVFGAADATDLAKGAVEVKP